MTAVLPPPVIPAPPPLPKVQFVDKPPPITRSDRPDIELVDPAANRRTIRGHRKLQLIRDLAEGRATYIELGARYDKHPDTILKFERDHREAVAAVSREMSNEMDRELTGLWIADKANRIAEYQALYEKVATHIDSVNPLVEPNPRLINQAASLLRNVAEERGHLPTRTSVQTEVTVVNYAVEGIDLKELK